MDGTFTASLRRALVERVNNSLAARRARRRRRAAGFAVVLALAGGGAALAVGTFSGQPGSERETTLGTPVTVTAAGTRTVHVGQPPASANFLRVQLTCYTAGTLEIGKGTSSTEAFTCDKRDLKSDGPATQGFVSRARPGGTSMTISADAKDRWKLTAAYVYDHSTPWGVNAQSQTYGVPNDHGSPDLFAVVATNGKPGYAYSDQYTARLNALLHKYSGQPEEASQGPNLINVYRSDGTTLIGHFNVGPPYRFTLPAPRPTSHWLRYTLIALLITAAGLIIGYLFVITGDAERCPPSDRDSEHGIVGPSAHLEL
jgi:hypothetical protein